MRVVRTHRSMAPLSPRTPRPSGFHAVVSFALFLSSASAAFASGSITAVPQGLPWREAFAWAARHGMTSAQYQQAFDDLVGLQGYALRHVNGYSVGGQARFAAIWDTGARPAWVARHDQTSQAYQANFDAFVSQGYRLVTVSGYTSGSQLLYAALWDKGSGPSWQARHGLTSDQYQAVFDANVSQGWRLRMVNGYEYGGRAYYACLFDRSTGGAWVARHGLSAAQYQQAFDGYVSQGYKLMHVSAYTEGGQPRFAALWEQGQGGAWVARHGLTSAQYQQAFDSYLAQGYRLRTVSGYGVGGQDYYAAIWDK